MDYQGLYRHVRDLFVTHWTASPFVFANESQDIPVTPVGDKDAAAYPACWVDVATEFVEAEYLTYADSSCDGFVRLTFWVENGAGEDRIFDLADTVRAMFATNGDVASDVEFFELRTVNTLEIEDAPFFGREFHIPFKLYLAR